MFELTASEEILWNKFRAKHWDNKCQQGTISVKFTPTGIGIVKEVQCPKCKKKKNITDYSQW